MGLLRSLFGGSASEGDDAGVEEATLTCNSCGSEVDEDEVEDGQCEECRSSEYSGPTYCCGAIYEDGEDTCKSCGEPL